MSSILKFALALHMRTLLRPFTPSAHLSSPLHPFSAEPGNVQFTKRGFLVNESIGKASIPVIRKNGADGEISVKWKTIDRSALSGKDFEGGEGMLIFKHTEVGGCSVGD